MTNGSVAYEATDLWVELDDKPYEADIIGLDPLTNISILKLKTMPESFKFLRMDECLELPEPGTLLVSISCKMGMDPGPSVGMVSGTNMDLPTIPLPTTHLRSDIPCHGGDMGAPVFDIQGRFIGVMMHSLDDINASLIFPARAAMRIREDLLFAGKVSYGYMGFEIDPEMLFKSQGKLVISKIMSNSPGSYAGLKTGDQLVEVNNQPLSRLGDLRNAAFFAHPGQYLSMKVLRNNRELNLSIRLREGPPPPQEDASEASQEVVAQK